MNKIVSIILCSSFFMLNGGRTMPIKHDHKQRIYRNLNNAFYATDYAWRKLRNKRGDLPYVPKKSKIYGDMKTIETYLRHAQTEINKYHGLQLLLKKPVRRLEEFVSLIVQKGKKCSISKAELRKDMDIVKKITIDVMFTLAERYNEVK
jgi:hypothetical protein